jgi:hypothetical protein
MITTATIVVASREASDSKSSTKIKNHRSVMKNFNSYLILTLEKLLYECVRMK